MASDLLPGPMAAAAAAVTLSRTSTTSTTSSAARRAGSWISQERAVWALHYIHFAYPIVLFFLFIVAFAAHGIMTANSDTAPVPLTVTGPGGKPLPNTRPPRERRRQKPGFSYPKRLVFVLLSVGHILTFLGNAINIVVHALTERSSGWWCGEAAAIYVVGSAFLYSLFLISIVDNVAAPNVVQLIVWVVAVVGEVVLLGVSAALYTSPHHEINSVGRAGSVVAGPASQWEIVELICDASRLLLLVLCIGLYLIFSIHRSPTSPPRSPEPGTPPSERTPLLLNGHAHGNGHVRGGGNSKYGSPRANGTAAGGDHPPGRDGRESPSDEAASADPHGRGSGPASPADSAAFYRPTTAQARSWWEYLRGYSLFFPYLWPSSSFRLQLIVVICFTIVILQRMMNLLVPYQMGVVVDALAGEDRAGPEMPWVQIALLICYRLVQGQSGLLGAARSVLWIPVAQYSYAALSTASFEHVHGLSLEFHLGKRTGEVLSALNKGAAINVFLEQVTFAVLPMLVDLGVAIAYFAIAFDAYYSLTVSVLTFWYLYLTIRLAQWRAEARRQMVNADREEDAVKNDSIQSYETVKYFGAEDYEFARYRNAVRAFQKAEYKVTLSLQVMNITQNLVFMLGLLVVSFIAAYQVTIGQRPVGKFITVSIYMTQLQGPLNYFGTFYRSVQSAMISGERLLELFKEQPTVVDEPGAAGMPTCEGQIRFDNVKFSYDARKPALEGLTFTCPPGTTTALVGESGGGKSTVFRLLFRFYNFQEGSIQLDGHDVRDVTIQALRSHIGVVPQDTILFNETLMYNLRYADPLASDEAIYNACRAASIHDKIMTFPDRYETKVGERGLRLSGGEKQRVAIARTILKNPRIIMLDEATAALDSETEQNIQEALKTLSEGRTMLVIAHRLSTITTADQILVLHQGAVAESGTHEELLAKKGRYAAMWKKQIRAEEAAREAQVLSDRAAQLREEALQRPGSREGLTSEETSENEADTGRRPSDPARAAPGIAVRVFDRAAEGLRGAADIFHDQRNENSQSDGSDDHSS